MKNTPIYCRGRLFLVAGLSIGTAAILLVGGCSKAMAPSFRAVGVREIQQSNERSIIEFSIEASNPNKEPIPLRQIHYAVELDGVEVFRGVRSPEITLHTYSSQMFTLPAVIPMDALSGNGEVSYALLGSAQYIPPGRLAEVLFDAELKVPEVSMNLTGTINTGSSDDASSAPDAESE